MSRLIEQVERTIQTRRLFAAGQRILVAVSGGLDSVVLLQVLHELSKQHGWLLAVGHLNHQLRGRSSEADERLVRRLAQSLGLPVLIERADVRGLARTKKVSLEMAARELRHDFLARAALAQQACTVALAHHADDQLELFFLRFLRGSGPEGLAGMKWRSPSAANANVVLARPLLEQPKSALREYAKKHKLKYREDASNTCLDILRNRLRHDLLPLLRRRYQPALTNIAIRTMDLLGAEADVVAEAATEWLQARRVALVGRRKKISQKPANAHTASFTELPVAVQRRCLQRQLFEQGVVPDYDLIEQIRLAPGRRVSVCGTIGCFRDSAGLVYLEPTPAFKGEALDIDLRASAGRVRFGGIEIAWRVEKAGRKTRAGRKSSREWFDADRVGSPVTLRHWRAGDRFQPIGMAHNVKLQNFFTNQKVPQGRRRQLVVAATALGELFWVEGQRISERFKLTNSTTRRLQWGWQRL